MLSRSSVTATRGIPAKANFIGSAMFVASLLVVVGGQVISHRRAKALAAR